MKARSRISAFIILVVAVIACSSGGEEKKASFLKETPIDEVNSIVTFSPGEVGGKHVANRAMALMCEIVRLTLEKDFFYFYISERKMNDDGTHSFKISFFRDVPEDLPFYDPADESGTEVDPETAVIDARFFMEICGIEREED